MTLPELSGPEYAVPAQLEQIYNTTVRWLAFHGESVDTGPLPLISERHEDGILISEYTSGLTCEFAGDIVRRIAPEAAATLNIGRMLSVSETIPHYIRQEDGRLKYLASKCVINILQVDDGSGEMLETIWIAGPDAENPWSTQRQTLPYSEESGTEEPIKLSDEAEQDTASHQVTQKEAWALNEIASRYYALNG